MIPEEFDWHDDGEKSLRVFMNKPVLVIMAAGMEADTVD